LLKSFLAFQKFLSFGLGKSQPNHLKLFAKGQRENFDAQKFPPQKRRIMLLKDCTLAILGVGKMGSAFAKGLLLSRALSAERLVLLESDCARRDSLEKEFAKAALFSHLDCAPPVNILLAAVKPDAVREALRSCAAKLSPSTLVISLAAGINMAALASYLPLGQPLIRAMPNVGALAGRGITAFVPGPEVSEEQLAMAVQLFRAVGEALRVPETQMDAVTALSGSGPAYLALIAEAMIDAGVQQGLNREAAFALALNTMLGAAVLMLHNHMHPALLKDMVTSPAGTTIAGIMELEKAGVRGAIMRAVQAAARRSRELG
jgi:pyrroline-5-carboxylate reductase